jgi:hypothetical protein
MNYRCQAYCCQCQKTLVRVWAEEPIDLHHVICLEGDHDIEVSTEEWESIDAMNGAYHHA